MKRIQEWEDELKMERNSFQSNETEYEQGMILLKERYNQNMDNLIKYGLDVQKREVNL